MNTDKQHVLAEPMKIKEKEFVKYISHQDIQGRVREIAAEIDQSYQERQPLFVGILNGAFMFAADLMKEVAIDSEISFVKFSSYEEMESTGNVKQLIGLGENIFQKHIIIVEDIIDTGRTIKRVLDEFESLGASSVAVVTLLRKPEALKEDLGMSPAYVGFDIPNKFVVGYGLDYDGLGRNLKDIYQLKA